MLEIIQNMFFKHSGIKLKTIKISTRILQSVWKLRNTLLNILWVKEETRVENRKYFEKVVNENMVKSLRYAAKAVFRNI